MCGNHIGTAIQNEKCNAHDMFLHDSQTKLNPAGHAYD